MKVSQRFQSSRPTVDKTAWTLVLFDFGGTLDADGIAWKERFFRLYQDEGVRLSSEQFDQVFYAADDALVGAIPATLSFRDTVACLSQSVTQGLGLRDPMLGERVAKRPLSVSPRRPWPKNQVGKAEHGYRSLGDYRSLQRDEGRR